MCIPLKGGGDNFGLRQFSGNIMKNEQMMIVIVIPGRDANSYMNAIPTAIAINQSESYGLLSRINAHLGPRMPKSVTVRGRTFDLTYFRMADRAFMSFELAEQGQSASSNGIFCLRRFGLNGFCVRRSG